MISILFIYLFIWLYEDKYALKHIAIMFYIEY